MTTRFCGLVLGAALALTAGAGEDHVAILPDTLNWKPIGDQGAEMAIVYGDPKAEGVYVMRLRVPQGVKIMPHTHADAWRVSTVLSGTLYFGVGPTFEEADLVAYPAGTVFTEHPDLQHYAYAKDGPVEAQLTAMGPTGTTPVKPAE